MGENLRTTGNCISAEYIVELLEKVKDEGRKNKMKLKMYDLGNSNIHMHEQWSHKYMEYALCIFS
jgi:hypothetical protein